MNTIHVNPSDWITVITDNKDRLIKVEVSGKTVHSNPFAASITQQINSVTKNEEKEMEKQTEKEMDEVDKFDEYGNYTIEYLIKRAERDMFQLEGQALSYRVHRLIADNEKHKTDIANMHKDFTVTREENEKLKGEAKIEKSSLKEYRRIVELMPNIEKGMYLKNLESFIKKHIAESRKKGEWYVVRHSDYVNKLPALYDNSGVWYFNGISRKESEFSYISTTPINLGE